jgi:hypothetical protein
MQKTRLLWLFSSLALLALINVAVFGGLFSSRTINLHWRVLAQSSDDAGEYLIVQFAMSDERAIKSIQVQRLDTNGDAVETIWQVKGKSNPIDTFSFGSTLNGMERTDDHDGRPRLRPGQTYRIRLKATGFKNGELEFET